MTTTVSNINCPSRPILNSAGAVLDDYELCKSALRKIEDYQAREGKPAPISPEFVQFMRDAVDYIDKGGSSMAEFKQAHVQKQFDYDVIIKNTEAKNAELEKKGVFNSRVVQQIKGVSK